MIFGASAPSSAAHQARPPELAVTGTRPRSRGEAAIAATTPAAPIWPMSGTVKPKWKPLAVAHRRLAGGEVGMDAKRRLHKSERRDDHPPDALDRVERQDAAVPLDQRPHHVGLARRAEGGA